MPIKKRKNSGKYNFIFICKRISKLPFLFLIFLYQVGISPFMPHACRFQPTCSEYSKEAIQTHGIIKGIYLTAKRILRCHPFGGSGFDPIPPRKNKK
jgi:putative membrane protein insertion efficiency factor